MAVKILDLCTIAPPQGSAPPTSLRLLYFDLLWVAIPITTQCAFLYHVPRISTATFHGTHLPVLKRSLSLALKRFYPLAGRLVDDDSAPYLRYSDGNSVNLAVAESDDDLEELASHRPKAAERVRSLVPELATTASGDERPLLALQVTLFPDQGVVVGLTAAHAAVDGYSFVHFVRTWASISKCGGDDGAIEEELPVYDRSIISDSQRLREIFLSISKDRKKHDEKGSHWNREKPELVRATFTLTAEEIEKLRTWVASKAHGDDRRRCSSLTLAVALSWTCLLKTGEQSQQEKEALILPVECRFRLLPPVPVSYFGNCVSSCVVVEEKGRLVGEEGLVTAASALTRALAGLEDIGKRMDEPFDAARSVGPRRPMSVAGSPRLGLYRVDFGWGRPVKCEMVHVEGHRNMSIAEKGDEEGGGLEMGFALPPHHMRNFAHHFASTLSKLCSPST